MPSSRLASLPNSIVTAFAAFGFLFLIITFLGALIFGFIKYLYPFMSGFLATDQGITVAFSFKLAMLGLVLIFFGVMYWISYVFSIQYIENSLVQKPRLILKIAVFIIALPLFLFLSIMAPLVDLGTTLLKHKLFWYAGLVAGCIAIIAAALGLAYIVKNNLL
jgi:hypothetical protein